MSAKYFLDTNVFIYQLERLDPKKARISDDLIKSGIAQGSGCISFQVVQECINTALRKAEVPLSEVQIRQYLDDVLAELWTVHPSLGLYRGTLDIARRYGFSFYDSLIVAAALDAGCKTLFTEDLSHGQEIHGLTITNPFVSRESTP